MQQGTTAWSRATARTRHVSMHTFALRHPDLWERLRYLKKWTLDNWDKGYVRAEGPPGEKDNFTPGTGLDLDGDEPPTPFVRDHDKRTEVNGLALAEAVSSQDVKTGEHCIAIDIDRPAWLIPSTREDHFHLIVQMGTSGHGLDWPAYERWLRASAAIGLIEEGYMEAAVRRRATFLRLPWIRKGSELADRQRALGWWIEQEGVDLDGRPKPPPDEDLPF